MSDRYLSLHTLGALVSRKTGVPVDTTALAARPATVSDLGIDSLGWLGVVGELENEYDLSLDDGEAIETLPAMVSYVNRMLDGGTRTPGHTDNRVVIAAPLPIVWSMTNDVESWPKLFSEYASAEILERHGDRVLFRLATHPDETGTVYRWVSERVPDEATHTVRAHRVETGFFEYMDIEWRYTEVEGGVEMRWIQDFATKPGAPATTEGMTAYINENSAVQMERIRGIVEAAAGSPR
ncbi:hypothetical protein GCM10010172_19350 [Paractinoplanes ferrugineus]|uniref:Aromatase n=1 Tax=Paractinoplanes ferrugineus TaxID=113564 RepID=A0A919MIP2_9ACTN|nr:SRPBCC family protein [Actinoplanes ferrugineus]GIE16234.1 hypothetical protein Afe05nite_80740 [Actinoplanes ferrugineus]